MITIGTRLRDKACFPQLAACAQLFSQLERALFVALHVHREPVTAAKSRFIEEHQITARQFNALRNQVEAKVESWRECLKVNLVTIQDKIARVTADLKRIKRPVAKQRKERQLVAFAHRVARIDARLAAPVPSICFGSRKLFRAQYDLRANGYKTHADWLTDWQAARSSGFFVLGSADET